MISTFLEIDKLNLVTLKMQDLFKYNMIISNDATDRCYGSSIESHFNGLPAI